jgi:hypothetical protein
MSNRNLVEQEDVDESLVNMQAIVGVNESELLQFLHE